MMEWFFPVRGFMFLKLSKNWFQQKHFGGNFGFATPYKRWPHLDLHNIIFIAKDDVLFWLK